MTDQEVGQDILKKYLWMICPNMSTLLLGCLQSPHKHISLIRATAAVVHVGHRPQLPNGSAPSTRQLRRKNETLFLLMDSLKMDLGMPLLLAGRRPSQNGQERS